MLQFGHDHIAIEHRFVDDSSKTSLKAVLLHQGNKLPSLPLTIVLIGKKIQCCDTSFRKRKIRRSQMANLC